MRLVRIKQKFQVTIPASIREKLHLEEGELLEATTKGGTILFTPKAVVNRPDVEAGIADALEDKRKGRTLGPFKTGAELRKARQGKAFRALAGKA